MHNGHDNAMLRHLDYKVTVFISVALIAVALLAANSIGILLDIKRDADVQIREANQAAFNADFDVALARAAGEATSFVATKREDVSAHGKLETAANARGLQGDAQKIIHALIAILTVLVLIIGFGLIFTSRLIFKPINLKFLPFCSH